MINTLRALAQGLLRHGAGLSLLVCSWLWGPAALGAVFTVTNTADSGPGTLRSAITNANALPGLDTIEFAIPGPGPHTIQLTTALPSIVDPVVINGYSQAGASSNSLAVGNNAVLQIRLSGGGTVNTGLRIQAAGSAVYGLAILDFTGAGIYLLSGTNIVIQGNFIGLDVDGATVRGNGVGIRSTARSAVIGGPLPWQRNVISGNRQGGVSIQNSANNFIQGNYIGTDASGSLARGNGFVGVELIGPNSFGTVIGGSQPGEGNVIAATTGTGLTNHGVYISGAPNIQVEGNYIGTDATGTNALGNLGGGISVAGTNAVNIRIGGTEPGAGNVIAFNASNGVQVVSGSCAILGNRILANAAQGIDLGGDGFTANDPGDTDTGPNGRQNWPELIAASSGSQNTTVFGQLNSQANTLYRLEFFAAPSCGDALVLIGAYEGTSDATGLLEFYATFDIGGLAGWFITATATDPQGNTSELSLCAPVSTEPAILVQPQPQVVNEGDPVTLWVVAAGSPPIHYQWFHNDVPLPNGTNATLSIAAALPLHAGTYTVLLTNIDGAVLSQPALLTVVVPTVPVVVDQPESLSVVPGTTTNLTVSFSAAGPVRIQWRLNGVDIPGATNATLTLTNIQPTQGGSYSAVIWTPAGAVNTAEAVLSVQVPTLAFKDDFTALTQLTAETGTGRSSNTLASAQPGEPMHAGKPGGKSIWIIWRASKTGIATFSTAGSSFDTLLAVYTGTGLSDLVEVASDDDGGGFLTSQVQFNAVAGQQYLIAVDGFGGASGEVVLNWNLEVTAQVLPVIVSQPNGQTVVPGGTAIFTVGATGTDLSYQWFFNGQALAGATNSELVLEGVTEAQVGKYCVRVSNPYRSVNSQHARLELAWTESGSSRARTSGKFLEAVLWPHRMELGAPVEQFRGVRRLSGSGTVSRGYTGTQVFSTYGETKEPGEPNHCGIPGGASSWFVLTTTTNGLLRIDTEGSDFDTVLAVYTGPGTDFATLVPVACDNNSGADGRASKVIFAAVANTNYFIAVDGVNGATGRVKLNYVLGEPPVILTNPASARVAEGGAATLQVAARAIPGACYQWFRQGVPLPRATNACLALANFQPDQAGHYHVCVSNALGQATSQPALVQVAGPLRFSHQYRRAPDGFQLTIEGAAQTRYVIECSTNLQVWVPLATNLTLTGLWEFVDAGATNFDRRFYRVRVAP